MWFCIVYKQTYSKPKNIHTPTYKNTTINLQWNLKKSFYTPKYTETHHKASIHTLVHYTWTVHNSYIDPIQADKEKRLSQRFEFARETSYKATALSRQPPPDQWPLSFPQKQKANWGTHTRL